MNITLLYKMVNIWPWNCRASTQVPAGHTKCLRLCTLYLLHVAPQTPWWFCIIHKCHLCVLSGCRSRHSFLFLCKLVVQELQHWMALKQGMRGKKLVSLSHATKHGQQKAFNIITRFSRIVSLEFNFNDSRWSMASWNPLIASSSLPRFLSKSATLAREVARSTTWSKREAQDVRCLTLYNDIQK